MPKYLSPGNYFVEVDISDYPAGVNSSVVGIIGFASKGPIAGKNGKKATLITSQENLIDTFGEPAENIPGQALEAALEVLESTNNIYFIRCASSTALEASTAAPVGWCPALRVPGYLSGMYEFGTDDAGTKAVRFNVIVKDNTGATILSETSFDLPKGTVAASADGGNTFAALQKVIGGSLDADKVGVFGKRKDSAATAAGSGTDSSAFIVGLAAGSGASVSCGMQINAATDGTTTGTWNNITGMNNTDGGPGINQGLAALSGDGVTYRSGPAAPYFQAGTASGGTLQIPGTSGVFYWTRSIFPGAGYNEGTTPEGNTSGNSITINVNGNSNSILEVNTNGTALESFKGGLTSSVFLENQIGKTNATATSQTLVGFFTSAQGNFPLASVSSLNTFHSQLGAFTSGASNFGGSHNGSSMLQFNPRFTKLVQGTYSFVGGNNGITVDSSGKETLLTGQVESDGGRSGIEALDDEELGVKIAMIPDFSELDGAQNALITKAESMQSFIALVSPTYGVGKTQDAINWSNGDNVDRTTAINSSYAAIYWPWVKTFSVFDGKDRWYAPEIFAARQMCVTDSVSRPWFAPAGLQRGRLTKPIDVEVVLNQGDRNSLYSGGNVINPIVKFDQDGIVIFGQRTALRANKATNRINIRRLMIDLRDTILQSTRQFAFEPNDRFTWDQVVNVVAPLLDEIKRERGVTEFKVICDETTNTPIRVDRNELWCKVLLKPTKTAEIIVFEINITNQSAQIGN
jgi:phage tail sheath protein FI